MNGTFMDSETSYFDLKKFLKNYTLLAKVQ